jgi:RNA polymerase sigma-B factor
VRPPREAAETWLEVAAASEQLGAMLGHAPTTADLAQHLDVPVDRVTAAMEARRGRWAVSLDAPAHADSEDRTVADQLGMEDEGLSRAFDRAWLSALAAMLEPLERDIVGLYFDGDLSQREIAARMGISQMKVCRVLHRAVDRLRAADATAAA